MDLILYQHPPPKKYKDMVRIANRLIKHRVAIFPFLYHRLVPPDNNGSERAIRNLKVKLKISGQFKGWDAAQNFAVIRSVIDTFIKKDKPILPNIQDIAQLTFKVPE